MCGHMLGVTLLLIGILSVAYGDIISELSTSEADEDRALEIKAEEFWKPVLSAAKDVKMEKHLALYKDVETEIKELPAENRYVKETLSQSLQHLRNADAMVFKQAVDSAATASDKLETQTASGKRFSFFSVGQDFLRRSLRKLVGNNQYADRLAEQVSDRQAGILPTLRGAAKVTGSVLSESRLATQKAFDVEKYDLYNRGVPKTPPKADDDADRIVEAAGETRSRFTKFIRDAALSIARDVERAKEPAATTVIRASSGASLAATDTSASPADSPVLKTGFSLSSSTVHQLTDV